MIALATQVEQVPVLEAFPEDLENDNEQSGESSDYLSEQVQEET